MGLLVVTLFISLFWNLVGQGLNDPSHLWQQRWIEAADHENIFVRAAAVDALAEMAPHSLAGREALAKRLLDHEPMIRRRAVEGLGAAGRLGSPYMPQMLKLQQFDVDADVRNSATLAVATIREEVASRRGSGSIWLLGAAILIGLSLGGYYWHRVWKAIEQEARAPVGKPVSI
jgi:HEAT repeat protein